MFTIARRITRPTLLLPVAMFAITLLGADAAVSASSYVDKTVRWSSSPLKNAQGQPLPPAMAYEVWLTEEGLAERLAGTESDTTYTLRAEPGVTYVMRVRGVSALGLKSAFSDYSDPYRSPEPTAAPVAMNPGFGPAHPNPFNAGTAISYGVPDDLAARALLTIGIYDVRGFRIRDFALDRAPGSHEVSWDGRNSEGARVPAGMYLARYECGDYTARLKLTLLT